MTYIGRSSSNTRERLISSGTFPTFVKDSPSNVVTVDIIPETADFTSVKEAVESITNASDSNQYVVEIAPGSYNEDPFVLPTGISLRGLPGSTLVANNNNANFITVQSVARVDIEGLFIIGPTGVGAGIFFDSGQLAVNNCGMRNSEIGILSDTSAPILLVDNCSFPSNGHPDRPYGTGIVIRGNSTGLDVRISNCAFGFKDTAIKMQGGNAAIIGSFCRATTKGIDIENGILNLQGFTSSAASTGIIITGGNLAGFGAKLNDSVVSDVVQRNQGNIFLNASDVNSNKLDIEDYSRAVLFFLDDRSFGDFGTQFIGQIAVGVPERGSESVFGQGDSYTRGMLVYQSGAGGGILENVSDLVNSRNNGVSLTFPGSGVNNAIFFASNLESEGGQKIKHHGIKTALSGLAEYDEGKAFTVELSSSTGWIPCEMMVTESTGLFRTARFDIFKSFTSEQVRYNIVKVNNLWEQIDLLGDGTPRFWSRIILHSGISMNPVIDEFKLHTSRTELNEDGYVEYFGNARVFGTIPYDLGLLEAAAASPANQDIYLSDNLDVGRVENELAAGATDRIGLVTFAPLDMDTSCPVDLLCMYFSDGTNTDTINWTVRWGFHTAGELLYQTQGAAPTTAANERSISFQTSGAGTTGQTSIWSQQLDWEGLITRRQRPDVGDVMFISIERQGGADAHSNNVVLVQIVPRYYRYTEGGHF